MPYFPTVNEVKTSQQMTDVFMGYNHRHKIGEGEFYDMKNLCSNYYPLMGNRGKRGICQTLDRPRAILGKSKLAYIDGGSIFYGGEDITPYFTAKGLSISNDKRLLPKKMISMGAYIIIYPDKLYINTEDYNDCGLIENERESTDGASIVYSICKRDGTDYQNPLLSSTEPDNPQNGQLWIDTSSTTHVLKQYSVGMKTWADIPTVYTKISTPQIGLGFSKFDGVDISGCDASGTALAGQMALINGSKLIWDVNENYIVVVGLLDSLYTQESGKIKVKRGMPDLDFITEAENRLWGCKYGMVNGRMVNEIYCCALGDFKNWDKFRGISTDSYVASVGTDGPWTGAITHLGHPIFFKENVLHKVYISSTGAHQIVDTACRGVQSGCGASLAVVNETLFYKSREGICAYDGSLPVCVSEQLGEEKYGKATAGAINDKYYISMEGSDGEYSLFVYDSAKRLWHREDDTKALAFARCGDELYYIDGNTNKIIAVNATTGTPEEDFRWSAETGIIGYNCVEHQYISRLNLRMKLPEGARCDMYIQYDSCGIWEHCGHMNGVGTNTFTLPIRPRRCDHFRFRIEGYGDIRLYSLAKIHEVGSDF